MRKYILIAVLLLSCNAFAQQGSAAFKLGYFNPSSAEGGMIVGYEGNSFLDEHVSIGWSIDWFHVNYTDKKIVTDYNNLGFGGGQVNELRAKTNLHDLPLEFTFTVGMPLNPLVEGYVIGGLGAEVLFVNYRNFENPENDEFKVAMAFNWRIGLGAAYSLNRRSQVFVEMDYHSAQPSWEYEVNDPLTGQKRTYERVFDMSGVMLRVGYRFYY